MRSDCHLGFAITGSFCTFEKIKKQIELLRDRDNHRKKRDSHDTGRRTGRTEEAVRCPCDCTLHGKHSSKACKWNHGYSGFDGGEVAPSERASRDHCYFHERCAWHQSAEYRKAYGDEAYLFRSVCVADMTKIAETVEYALAKEQIQPVLL